MLVVAKENYFKEDLVSELLNGDFQDAYVDTHVQDIERMISFQFGVKVEEFSDLIYTNCYVGLYPFKNEVSSDHFDGKTKNESDGEFYRLSFDKICTWATNSMEFDIDEETNLEEIKDEKFIKIFETLKKIIESLPDKFEIRILVDEEAIVSGKRENK